MLSREGAERRAREVLIGKGHKHRHCICSDCQSRIAGAIIAASRETRGQTIEECAEIAHRHSLDHEVQSARGKECGCAWCGASARIEKEILSLESKG